MTRRTPVRCAAMAITAGSRAFAPTSGGRSCILGAARPAALTTTCAPAKASARESMMPSSWSASSMMLSTSRARVASRGASMGSTLIPSAFRRATMEEPTKPLAPMTFHLDSDISFTSHEPAYIAGKNGVISTFPYLNSLWGICGFLFGLWSFFRTGCTAQIQAVKLIA